MRIGTITFHTAINYGAVLQTYALYKALKNKNQEVKVIDYRAPFNEKRFSPVSFSYFLNIRNLYGVFFKNSYQSYNKEKFESFLQTNIEFTSPIFKKEELVELNGSFDTFITGSDQVWNLACTEGDDSYYLQFVRDPVKRNSYAASLGYTVLPNSKESKYKSLIEGFNNISVRESAGVEIVNKLTNKSAELVLDPTLLLTKGQWREIADFSIVPQQKYLLLYLMSEDKVIINDAKKYAKDHGLEIIYINQRLFKLRGARNLKDISPEQWVGLFMYADAVFTNSFHGLVFAINFERNFFTRYIPRSIANSRLQTILDALDLHHRRIDSESINFVSQINYNEVEEKLSLLRSKSYNFLNRIIDGQ